MEENRYIKTQKDEFDETKKLYSDIVTVASTGLFFRTGQILGKKIAEIGKKERERYFEIAKKLLIENGWVVNVEFEGKKVIVSKSIEVIKSKNPNCHMLRGLLAKLYEEYYNTKASCEEVECEGTGGKNCVFIIGGEI